MYINFMALDRVGVVIHFAAFAQFCAAYNFTQYDVLKMPLYFFSTFIYFSWLREQDRAYINPSQWSTLVGLELVYNHM